MTVKAKYFCVGPPGCFVTTDVNLARTLVSLCDKDNDWTIAENVDTSPECWGMYANIHGTWYLQYPVFATKEQAEENAAVYTGTADLQIRPLYQEII